MKTLPNHEIVEVLQEDEKRVIAKVRERGGQKKFVVNYLKSTLPTSMEIAYFRHEIEILSSLKVEGVPNLVNVVEENGCFSLFYEDFEGISFRELIYEEPVSISKFLKISILICRTLKQIHATGLIHNNINPDNIFLNSEKDEALVIDFGNATDVKKDIKSGYRPSINEGSIFYMSPEQTGRYIQSIDHRTDLYSFGVALYEFATQKLPFTSSDPLELIHSHFAEIPESPIQIRPSFSESLSFIILKLLSKSVEDRYKSASGLLHDLLYCQSEYHLNGIVEPFELGKHDFQTTLRIPQKLYGRKLELKVLEQAFEKSRRGDLSIALINGEEGLGKTTLVNNFRNYVVAKRGIFIEGRFERNINLPYTAIIQIFDDLFEQLLKLEEKKLNQIRENILDKLGGNAGLITSMIPNSRYLLGENALPPTIPDQDAENRLLLTFRSLIKGLIEELGNVVGFLDDLQWADQPSLRLINWLVENATTKNIFFIGAYRSSKGETHTTLENWIQEISNMNLSINHIKLEGLHEADFRELMKDVFSASGKRINGLSDMIFKKTAGNPYFLAEFLRMIQEKNLITFQEDKIDFPWSWDEEAIEKLAATDNVIELIIARIEKLDKDCLKLLQSAACIGKQFDWETIAHLHPEIGKNKFGALLKKAIDEEFIYPIDQNYKYINQTNTAFNANYRFVHDRVLQAFYSYSSETTIQQNHLKLGRMGLKDISIKNSQGNLLEMANHLFLGSGLLEDPVEKKEVSSILLEAGKKVKDNSEYAIGLLKCALKLLPKDSFLTDPKLTFEIYLTLAQAEFIHGEFSESERRFVFIENNVRELELKITAICQKMILYLQLTRYDEAIFEGKRGLSMLEYALQDELQENINATLGNVLSVLGDRDVFDLLNEKEIDDPKTLMVVNLLSIILPAAYLSGKGTLWILTVLDLTYLVLTKGLTNQGVLGLSSFGMVMGQVIGDRKKGYDIGEVAIKIAERLKGNTNETELKFVSGTFLAPWVQNENIVNERLDQSIQAGIKYGNLPYVGYSFQVKLAMASFFGTPFPEINGYIEKNKSLIKSLGQPDSNLVMSFYGELLQPEINGNICPDLILNKTNEEFQEFLFSKKLYIPLGIYCHLKSLMDLIHGSYESVISLNKIVESIKDAFFSHLLLVSQRLNYFVATARIHLLNDNGKISEEVIAELEQLLLLTKEEDKAGNVFFNNTIGFMESMFQWVKNGKKSGMPSLEKVIQTGIETMNFKIVAFGSEFLGEEYFKQGKLTLAKAYLVDAVNAWDNFGCAYKSQQLRKKFSSLFYEKKVPGALNTWSSQQIRVLDQIDYMSVLKSSHLLLAEKELGSLLQEFLKICIENAGAQRGIFFSRNQEFWVKEAFYGEWLEEELEKAFKPSGLLNSVERKGLSICLSNASADEIYKDEFQLTNSKTGSVLCAPVYYNKKLKGIIYLENNLIQGAFGDETMEMINLLSKQIGISIENAQLYSSLEESNKQLENKVRERTKELSKLYSENERLLLNMLPSVIADRLKRGETYIADSYENVSVIFVDMVNFTGKSESLSPKKLVEEVHECFKGLDEICEKFKLEKIKTIGDAFLAVCGLPKPNPNHAIQVTKAAKEIIKFMDNRKKKGGLFDVRIGINSGPVVAGVVGVRKFAFDIWGDTVNVAARMEQNSETGKINISGNTYNLIKNDFDCIYRGKIAAKNKGEIDMYFVD